MDVERPAIRDLQALSRDGLDPDVVSPGSNGALNPGAQQVVEYAEQRILHVDSERQQPVEEGGDRRQVLTEAAVVIGKPPSGGVFERLQRAALDLATIDQKVELAERRPGIDGFEIVIGAEQPLAAGLAVALGGGAKR